MIRKIFTLFLSSLFVITGFWGNAQSKPKPEPTPNAKIVINIPAKTLSVFENDIKVRDFLIAVGEPHYKTPVGTKKISQIVWNPSWTPPASDWAIEYKATPAGAPDNPLGPVKMKLQNAILIHGTSNEQTIGTAASHGCIRMYNADARELAWWVQNRFSKKTDVKFLEEYVQNPTTSFTINLKKSLPVEFIYEIFSVENGNLKIIPDIYEVYEDPYVSALDWLKNENISLSKSGEKNLKRMVKLWVKKQQVASIQIPLQSLTGSADFARR